MVPTSLHTSSFFFSQAIPCALSGVKPGGRKPEKPPSVYWDEHFSEEKFKATFVDEVGVDRNKRWRVSLVAQDGRSAADQIIRDGYVLRDSGELNNKYNTTSRF